MKLNNLSVLPFYDNLAKQYHRLSYSFGNIYCYAFPRQYVPPFQIEVGTNTDYPTINVFLHNFETGEEINITSEIVNCGYFLARITAYQKIILINTGKFALTTEYSEGRYYLRVTVDSTEYFSEIFTWTDCTGRLKIEWYDRENLVSDDGIIIYKTHSYKYRNFVYLATELGKPEYSFEEEGESRDGYFFPEKQLSEKVYKFVFVAPEYLCDVMRTIRLSDHVIITDPYGRVFNCDTFLMTPKWQTQGDLASVECEFETNTVIKKIGKSVDAEELGAFNDDFNESFDVS